MCGWGWDKSGPGRNESSYSQLPKEGRSVIMGLNRRAVDMSKMEGPVWALRLGHPESRFSAVSSFP